MSICHVVTFRFVPDSGVEVVKSLSESLERVADSCTGIEYYWHGTDLGIRTGTSDYAIAAVFRDEHALHAYTNAPEHRRVNVEFARYVAEKSSVQFAVPPTSSQS